MKTYEIRMYSVTGKVIGTVQANTYAGGKQKWRKAVRDAGGDALNQSYWHIHFIVELGA